MLWTKAMVLSVKEKDIRRDIQMSAMEMNENEPLMTLRKARILPKARK